MSVTLLHKGEFTKLTLHADTGGNWFVRKTSFYPGSEKLVDEAKFIALTIPTSARPYFPEILRQKRRRTASKDYYYEMPHYSGRLLRQRLVNGNNLDEAVKDVKRTLSVLQDSLYVVQATDTPEAFTRKHYIDRIASRLSRYNNPGKRSMQLLTSSNQLTASQMEEFFTNVVSRNSVTVNGKQMLTPLEIVRRATTNTTLKQLLLPPIESMALIHGDPHLGNVMIRDESSAPLFFDPNGFHTGGDIAYDIGKFILSLDYLDLLLEGELNYPQIAWTDGEIQIGSLRSFKSPDKALKMEYISNALIHEILPEVFADRIKQDPQLIDRALFVANLHAFACAHTFIPTKQRYNSIPLLIYFMEQTQEQLGKITASSKGTF